jgi:hypothetical protein
VPCTGQDTEFDNRRPATRRCTRGPGLAPRDPHPVRVRPPQPTPPHPARNDHRRNCPKRDEAIATAEHALGHADESTAYQARSVVACSRAGIAPATEAAPRPARAVTAADHGVQIGTPDEVHAAAPPGQSGRPGVEAARLHRGTGYVGQRYGNGHKRVPVRDHRRKRSTIKLCPRCLSPSGGEPIVAIIPPYLIGDIMNDILTFAVCGILVAVTLLSIWYSRRSVAAVNRQTSQKRVAKDPSANAAAGATAGLWSGFGGGDGGSCGGDGGSSGGACN